MGAFCSSASAADEKNSQLVSVHQEQPAIQPGAHLGLLPVENKRFLSQCETTFADMSLTLVEEGGAEDEDRPAEVAEVWAEEEGVSSTPLYTTPQTEGLMVGPLSEEQESEIDLIDKETVSPVSEVAGEGTTLQPSEEWVGDLDWS